MKIFKFIYLSIKFIISIMVKIVSKVVNIFREGLRFSLTFKITTAYVLLFSFFLSLLSFSVYFGFNYFLEYTGKEKVRSYKVYIESTLIDSSFNYDTN